MKYTQILIIFTILIAGCTAQVLREGDVRDRVNLDVDLARELSNQHIGAPLRKVDKGDRIVCVDRRGWISIENEYIAAEKLHKLLQSWDKSTRIFLWIDKLSRQPDIRTLLTILDEQGLKDIRVVRVAADGKLTQEKVTTMPSTATE